MPDFRARLVRLGLSQVGAAALLDRNPRKVREWCKDGPPRDIEQVLTAVEEIAALTGETVASVLGRLYGTTPPAPVSRPSG